MSFHVCWYKSCPEESTTAFELDSRKVFRSLVLKTVDRTVPFFPRLYDMTLYRLGERPPRAWGFSAHCSLATYSVPFRRSGLCVPRCPMPRWCSSACPGREASFNALTCIWMAFENSPAIRAFPSKRRGSSGSEPFSMRSRPRSSTWFYRCKEAVGLPTRLRFCSARITAGFREPGGYCPDPERFLLYPDHGLEIDRLLSLVEFLGVPARGTHLEFPLRPEDYRALENIPEARRLQPGRYVCVHVGASTPAAPLAALEFRRGGRLACRSRVADRAYWHGRRSRLDRLGCRAASEWRREPGRTHRSWQPGGPLERRRSPDLQ